MEPLSEQFLAIIPPETMIMIAVLIIAAVLVIIVLEAVAVVEEAAMEMDALDQEILEKWDGERR